MYTAYLIKSLHPVKFFSSLREREIKVKTSRHKTPSGAQILQVKNLLLGN